MYNNLEWIGNHVHRIILEASSKEDIEYAKKLTKDEIHGINSILINNLYNSILKNAVDYGDIPNSKGDIDAIKNYSTPKCLDIIDELMVKNNISEPKIESIKKCINNIRNNKRLFQKGFAAKNNYVILLYNSIVLATIDATSTIIGNYMDYIIGPDQSKYQLSSKFDRGRGVLSLDNIDKFNTLVENGTFNQTVEYMMNAQRKNFVGEEVAVTVIIIGGLLVIIPLIRELIYYYYNSRVSISDYIKMQSDFLEMHELAIKASKFHTEKEKKEIIHKQRQIITKMRKLADKIAINSVDTNDIARKVAKDEESLWSLSSLEKRVSNGFREPNGQESENFIDFI